MAVVNEQKVKRVHVIVKRTNDKQTDYSNGVFFEASDTNRIIESKDSGEDASEKKKNKKHLNICDK